MHVTRKASLGLSVLALAALAALPAGAQTVVNFDDLTGSGILPTNYQGITWTTWAYYSDPQDPYTPKSDPERVYAVNSSGNNANEASFSFTAPVVFDGAWFSGYDTSDVTFSLFDNDGNLVGTSELASLSATPTFLGSGYGGLVKTVVVTGVDANYVMDDVTYEKSPVPEASTTASFGLLLVLGAGGLVVAARRKKAGASA